jgi:hypothetical protein
MTKQLPVRPNLEHLSTQAKELLQAHENGDPAAIARFRLLRRFTDAPDAAVLAAKVPLADALFVIALEYGFAGWSELKKHVETVAGRKPMEKMDDLETFSNRGIEVLLRDLDRTDVALCMLEMPGKLYEMFWKNMTGPARDRVHEDWGALGTPTAEQKQAARGRVLAIANKIAENEPEVFAGGETTMEEWEKQLTQEMEKKPVAARTSAELAPLFVELARVVRRVGLVAIEDFVEKRVDDELLKLGLRMTIGGTNMDEVRSIMQAKKTTMVLLYERRLEMIIAAVDGVGSGLNPALMEEKCRAFIR